MKPAISIVAAALFMASPAFPADDIKDMPDHGMQDGMKSDMMTPMMSNPHHKLGMAYMKNLQNFAEALKSDIATTGKVDKDLAATAVKEMKKSLDQMQKHHREMQKSMTAEMKSRMADMVKMMDNRFDATRQHLSSLEKEVKAKMPDPKKVTQELEQIGKQCEMMKKMHKGEMEK